MASSIKEIVDSVFDSSSPVIQDAIKRIDFYVEPDDTVPVAGVTADGFLNTTSRAPTEYAGEFRYEPNFRQFYVRLTQEPTRVPGSDWNGIEQNNVLEFHDVHGPTRYTIGAVNDIMGAGAMYLVDAVAIPA